MMSVLTLWQMWVMALLPAGIAALYFRYKSRGWSEEAQMHLKAAQEVAGMYAQQQYKNIAAVSGLRSAIALEKARTRKHTALALVFGIALSFVAFWLVPAMARLPPWVTVCAGVVGVVGLLALQKR